MSRDLVLVTGAAGAVGSEVVPLLRDRFRMRLMDRRRVRPAADDEVIRGDVRRRGVMRRACRGVAGVVHLAAVTGEWGSRRLHRRLLSVNGMGTLTVLEACRLEGIPKVVLASTARTVIGYPDDVVVTPDMPPRPVSVYASTKVFGDALGRHYADGHDMSVICLRIGRFGRTRAASEPPDALRRWCTPEDLAELIVLAIGTDLRYGVLFAVSDGSARFDDSAVRDLLRPGTRPRTRAEPAAGGLRPGGRA